MQNKVLIIGELKEKTLRHVTLEAIAAVHQWMPKLTVYVAIFGPKQQDVVEQLSKLGADQIYFVENEELQPYRSDAYLQAILQLIEKVEPTVIMLGHTAIGKELSPRIAAKLNAGLISDCIEIRATERIVQEEGNILEGISFVRPIYAGKAFEVKGFDKQLDPPYILTIRPNNFEPLMGDATRKAVVEVLQIQLQDVRTTIKEVVRKTSGKLDLAEAKIIVAGGRGVKSAEGFEPLQKLADVLGAAVGASRGACDANYCDYSLQIGQTGKVVTPELYIACGISGAIQHVAGMSNSKVIVAINKDPEAEIFKIADYGIVGDLFEVVPILTEELSKLLDIDSK